MEIRKTGKEAAAYLGCGIASMAVSWIAMMAVNIGFFGGVGHPGPGANAILGLVNWTAGMSSAFILTRRLVFRSDGPAVREFGRHAASRIGTLALDQAGRQLLGAAGMHVYAATAVMTVITTAANYILAKLFVFGKRRENT